MDEQYGGIVPAGTVITITNLNDTASQPISTNIGTADESVAAASFTVATTDNIYAYLGASLAPTAFLTAVDNGGSGFDLTNTGLTSGTNALDLSGIVDPADREYTGGRASQPTFGSYGALINNPSNWGAIGSGGFNTTAFVAIPEPNGFLLLTLVLGVIGVKRRVARLDAIS